MARVIEKGVVLVASQRDLRPLLRDPQAVIEQDAILIAMPDWFYTPGSIDPREFADLIVETVRQVRELQS